MVSSRSQLHDSEPRPASTTPAPTTAWRSTFAFIKDQLLQFWPPYREEIDDDHRHASVDPAAGKSEKPPRQLP